MSDDKKNKKPELTEHEQLAKLKSKYELAKEYYARDQRRMRMLEMTDNGDMWRAIGSDFPAYQILPDTNFVSYVKDNILASLYTTAKSAEIIPTSEDDRELCTKLNLVLNNFWSTQNVGYKQFQAGERAALLNLGITQVGWNEHEYSGKGDYAHKGQVVIRNINPMNFMRDPFSSCLEEASWCCTYERLHKSVILADERYRDKFKEWLKKGDGIGENEVFPNYGSTRENAAQLDHYNLFRWWVKTPDGIDEIHTISHDVILYKKENIKPSVFPFAELYCNSPSSGLVGISGPAKIFANGVAYNLMNSLALTAEYKQQRPPKFVSAQSGLNIAAFTRYGSEADRTFVVNQDAERAVHYHQFPPISANINNVMQGLQFDIQNVSGVDAKYTGRDTGSIITTGGTEEMLNRVTMIDTPKIINYENYTKNLTQLILRYMIEFSPSRKYFIRKPNTTEYESVEIDFPNIDEKTLFNYEIAISSELPKNKQRIAAWADAIMEKQMQYRQEGGQQVELLTEEEWLMFQDVPFKEMLLERMGFQRDTDALQQTNQVLFQYASLIEQGMSPQDAMLMTAETLGKTQAGQKLTPEEQMLGPMGQAGAMQPAAAGADMTGMSAAPVATPPGQDMMSMFAE